MRHVASIFAVLAIATPALAQTVNEQGAAQLTSDLKRYVGETVFAKGIVKVAVDGGGYTITFDPKALSAFIPAQAGAKFDIAPYSLRVKPRPDMTWDVAGDAMPNGAFEFNGPQGRQHMSWTLANGRMTGVYDPALAIFTTAESSMDGMAMKSGDPTQETDASFGNGAFAMTGKLAANGGVDVTSTQSVANFAEKVTINDPSIGLNMPVTLTTPKIDVTSSATGFRSRAMLNLLAFGVANAEDSKVRANQAELKTKLLATLPLWDKLEGSYGLNGIQVGTPIGNFGASQLAVRFTGTGISRNGTLNYGVKIGGLTVPAGVLPAWSATLMPTELDLNLGGANLDLDSLVREAIEAFDLTKEPPIADEVGAELAADFLAKGPRFVIAESFVKNKDTQFTFSGDIVMQGERPDLNVTIDATGYDKMVEALQAAATSDPQAQQIFPVTLAFKGFAKTLPDGALQWIVNARADGSIFINGGLIKGADTIPAPEPIPEPIAPGAPPAPPANPQ